MVVEGVGIFVLMVSVYLCRRSGQARGFRLELKARVLTSRNGRRDTSTRHVEMEAR